MGLRVNTNIAALNAQRHLTSVSDRLAGNFSRLSSGLRINRAADELAEVDVIWYIRHKLALLFEVEWTAVLGETLLRRHARIGVDDKLVRFLVVAPERTDLIRHKLERSPLLRNAIEEQGWNLVKWDHLRTWLAADQPDLVSEYRSRLSTVLF